MATPRFGRLMPLEARENPLVSLAYDLAEQQLLEGSASAMVINHLLKLRTTEEHFP